MFQNFGQVRDRYGTQASTIVTNFLVKVLIGATTDRELLELLSVLIGKEEITQESLTYGVDGSRVATASIHQRELVPIHSLAQQRPARPWPFSATADRSGSGSTRTPSWRSSATRFRRNRHGSGAGSAAA